MNDKITIILKEMGLTDYEARAYRALLDLGVATASRVSEHAGVPYSKIYEVLNSLERKGWIETEADRPRKYYPKPPTEALETTRLKLERRIKAWEKTVKEEVQPLYEKREIREKPDIWILRGENIALAKVSELLGKAKDEIMVAVPNITKNLIDVVVPLLEKLTENQVRVLILLSRKKIDLKHLKFIERFADVRLRDNLFGGGVIVDGKEAVLILGEEDKPSLVIWSDHSGLVKFAREYFKSLWETAELNYYN